MSVLRKLAAAIALGACAAFAMSSFGGCGRGVRVGTYNVRRFGNESTDMARLAAIVASTDVDVLAVQEVQSEKHLRDLAARLSKGERAYRVALSKCGGKSEMRIGFLYDASRVALTATKEYPELSPGDDGRCTDGERPGFLGVFEAGGRTVHLLAVHLAKGGESDAFDTRKKQWEKAYAIVARLRAAGAESVVILGDANSTGYREDDNGERRFVDERARSAGMRVETSGVGCTEYFPAKKDLLSPSLLDHAVATPGLAVRGSARVHGFCAELACAPTRTRPDDFARVSDHCPVTIDLAR